MDDVWMWFSGRPAVRACWHCLREKNGSSVRSRSERRDCDALPNWTLQRTWSPPTLDEVAKQPPEQRLGRMSRTAVDLAAATRGQSQAILMRRPGLTAARARDGSTCTLRCDRRVDVPRLRDRAVIHSHDDVAVRVLRCAHGKGPSVVIKEL